VCWGSRRQPSNHEIAELRERAFQLESDLELAGLKARQWRERAEVLEQRLAGEEWTGGDRSSLPLNAPRRAWVADTLHRVGEVVVVRQSEHEVRLMVPEVVGPSKQSTRVTLEDDSRLPTSWELLAHRPLAYRSPVENEFTCNLCEISSRLHCRVHLSPCCPGRCPAELQLPQEEGEAR
jgi:hypothetical protein